MNTIIILYFLINLVIAFFVAKDAEKWSMGGGIWFFIVLFLSLIGVIIYLLARNPANNPAIKSEPRKTRSKTKMCPQCAEEVKKDAKICRFCRYEFQTEVESKKVNSELLNFPVELKIEAEFAKVFEQKNNRGSVLKKIEKGTLVTVIDQKGEFGKWLEIEFGTGRTGYILKYDVGF